MNKNNKAPYIPMYFRYVLLALFLAFFLPIYFKDFQRLQTTSEEITLMSEYETVFNIENLQTEPIILVTNNYEPYIYNDPDRFSFVEEVVEAALLAAEVDYVIERYPWERCLEMVQTGRAFGTFPYIETKERKSRYIFSSSIMDTMDDFTVLFYNRQIRELEGVHIDNMQQLSTYRIGVMSNFYYLPIISNYNLKTETAYDQVYLFHELAAGRLDIVVSDYYVGEYIVEENLPEQAKDIGVLDYEWPVHYDYYKVMMDKENPQAKWFIQAFDEGMQIIQNNGQYDDLYKKFQDEF
ncbi:transporter substrate-binding domain-containing protein [Vallitaleaceae bacterium 9-2]